MVVGVGLCIGVLDFGGDRRREGAVFEALKGKRLGLSIVTNGIVCMRGGKAALPKLIWVFLVI